jgi:adenine-specific DNA-methyltransferase
VFGLQISYMGTKRRLSPRIAEVVADCRSGPFLDAFAGMCSVGSQVAPLRQVWANDVQSFSNTVAKALFQSADWPPGAQEISAAVLRDFHLNVLTGMAAYGHLIAAEMKALKSGDHQSLRDLFEEAILQTEFAARLEGGHHNLFCERYATIYFSTAQCLEIDSFRFAIDALHGRGELTTDGHRWCLLALACALNRCATSTGHFAQPLAPKSDNISRIAKQRSRSILIEALRALEELRPLGTKRWRSKNQVFQKDAAALLSDIPATNARPGVVYADPPYTDDQYSRYYHLYETLILYDYPGCSGRGRYREGRIVSDYSLPTKVRSAIEALIRCAASAGSDLILSYPSEGILKNSRAVIPSMCQTYYGRTPKVIEIEHHHSTMGASKGAAAAHPVVELLYRASA